MKMFWEADRGLKSTQQDALENWVNSLIRTTTLLSCSIVLSMGFGLSLQTKSFWTKYLLGVSALGVAGAVIVSGNDCVEDGIDYFTLNSHKTRGSWRDKSLDATLDYHRQKWVGSLKTHIIERAPLEVSPIQTVPENTYQVPSQYRGSTLAKNLKSTIIVGQPGSGKGLLVCDGLREVRKQYPTIQIWAVTVKDDPSEASRWNVCDQVFSDELAAFGDSSSWFTRLETFLDDFSRVPGQKLLVFDEALATKESNPRFFKGFMASLNHLASTGRSRGVFVWLISQTPNTADFGISGGARNVYRRLLLVSNEDHGLLLNQTTFSSLPLKEELPHLFSQTGRIVFDSLGNTWYPLAVIPEVNEEPIDRGSRHLLLEASYQIPTAYAEDPPEDDPESDLAIPTGLLSYIQNHEGVDMKKLNRNWARNRKIDYETLENMVESLVRFGKITCRNGGFWVV